jgi:hypothetical protein
MPVRDAVRDDRRARHRIAEPARFEGDDRVTELR